MGAVAIVFVAGIVIAVGLVLVVRIPAFESRRVRLVTLIVIAGVLVVGTGAGSIWALATIDGAVDQRVDALRPVLSRSTADPERLYGTRAARSLPGDSEVFPELPTGRAVVVLSEVSRWWVRHCVRARVSRAGVSFTTSDRPVTGEAPAGCVRFRDGRVVVSVVPERVPRGVHRVRRLRSRARGEPAGRGGDAGTTASGAVERA